jgi:hypothetical protein
MPVTPRFPHELGIVAEKVSYTAIPAKARLASGDFSQQ